MTSSSQNEAKRRKCEQKVCSHVPVTSPVTVTTSCTLATFLQSSSFGEFKKKKKWLFTDHETKSPLKEPTLQKLHRRPTYHSIHGETDFWISPKTGEQTRRTHETWCDPYIPDPFCAYCKICHFTTICRFSTQSTATILIVTDPPDPWTYTRGDYNRPTRGRKHHNQQEQQTSPAK